MSAKDNGGPAFPVKEEYSESQGRYVQYASDGMTLRDYFAAKFMSGVIASQSDYKSYEDISNDAYAMADAMLAERAK